jgi:hypothetical protein
MKNLVKKPIQILLALLLVASAATIFLNAPAAEATGPGGFSIPEQGIWFVTARAASVQAKCTGRFGAGTACVEWCRLSSGLQPTGNICCVRESALVRNDRADCLR